MGALDECHYCVELENGVNFDGCLDLDCEGDRETVAIEDAVRVLLLGLGENIAREGLQKTPLRVAKALREGTRGYNQNVSDIVSSALFPESGLDTKVGRAGGTGGLVIVRDLNLFSYCESCLLPFHVRCDVGYVPSGQRVLGLSKLSRVAEVFAKRLQDPQRLAHEICYSLQQSIKPTGVAVLLHCSHIHFPDLRSATFDPSHQESINCRVSSGSGVFEDEKADIWMDFVSLVRFRGVDAEPRGDDISWCPSHSLCKAGSSLDSSMLTAVSSIMISLGEDPLRKELIETPSRFVRWLMNFMDSKLDLKMNGFVRGTTDASTNGNIHHSHEEHHICSELNLSFWSQCEHHLLPFHGVVHVGYFGSSIASRPLVQSVVHFYGFKLQVQERLTRQIAETVSSFLGEDVIVVVEATHTCMISRGIEKFGSSTATIAVMGRFSSDPSARANFLQSIPNYQLPPL